MEQPKEDLITKSIRMNRTKIIADVILVVVFILIGFYIIHNIQEFKALGSDVCRLCEEKTGGICSSGIGQPQVPEDLKNYQVPSEYKDVFKDIGS